MKCGSVVETRDRPDAPLYRLKLGSTSSIRPDGLTMSYCLNPLCIQPHNPDILLQCQSCSTTLRLGDRYLPLRPLGQGGFGKTFLAVDIADPLKPRYVIKQALVQGDDPVDPSANPLRQEADGLEQLAGHSQIPQMITFLEQEGWPYLVQEWIDGQNLAEEMAAQGAWDEPRIRQLLTDLLPVLQFMHDRRIIHRDIKPDNIIRRRLDQQLVLVDLGAAKYATGLALGQTGTVIGSAEYTAPEQMRGKAIFASDLYSLGVTCLHLLTDLSPFDLFDSSEDQWVWREFLPQAVSPALGRILDRLVDNATRHRYVSATDVLKDLAEPTSLPPLPASKPGIRSRPARPKADRCAGDRTRRPQSSRRLGRSRSLEISQGFQTLLLVMPLIVGIVVGVSWLEGQARSLPPTDKVPISVLDDAWLHARSRGG
jgi:serine/threonine protein kinase